jgi:hypothetical protein
VAAQHREKGPSTGESLCLAWAWPNGWAYYFVKFFLVGDDRQLGEKWPNSSFFAMKNTIRLAPNRHLGDNRLHPGSTLSPSVAMEFKLRSGLYRPWSITWFQFRGLYHHLGHKSAIMRSPSLRFRTICSDTYLIRRETYFYHRKVPRWHNCVPENRESWKGAVS